MTAVRAATLEDIDELVELGALHAVDDGVYDLEYAPDRVAFLLDRAIAGGGVQVAEGADGLVGYIVAEQVPIWCMDGTLVCVHAFFVKADQRRGFAATAMVRALIRWAREQDGASKLLLHITEGPSADMARRLLEGHGFERLEVVMALDLDSHAAQRV